MSTFRFKLRVHNLFEARALIKEASGAYEDETIIVSHAGEYLGTLRDGLILFDADDQTRVQK